MKILLIDNGSSLLSKLEELIPGAEIVKRWDDLSAIEMEDFDLIILSGSKNFSVEWEHQKFQKEVEIIKSTQKPLIGICFGCELVAYSFGGTLKKLASGHLGIRKIEIVDRLFFDRKEILAYEYHNWIIDKMPSDFEILAVSKDGPEIIKHRNLPIYGLQFHPENLTEITDADDVFFAILKKVC